MPENKQHLKRYLILLWIGCIIGAWSILPYIYYLRILPPQIQIPKVVMLTTIQYTIFYGIICVLCYLLIPKTDLQPFQTDRWMKKIIIPGFFWGIGVGFVIYILDRFIFKVTYQGFQLPVWASGVASLYGGINEEVLTRLFLFTFFYFLTMKVFRFQPKNRIYFLWITNVIVALLFGLGHLLTAFKIGGSTHFEITRIIVLNAVPALLLGWLYWTRGIFAAMWSHFVIDWMVHVIVQS